MFSCQRVLVFFMSKLGGWSGRFRPWDGGSLTPWWRGLEEMDGYHVKCLLNALCQWVVRGTTQGILYQNKIFSWLNIIYHNVSDIVSQNMIIFQCFCQLPRLAKKTKGQVRWSKRQLGKQKDKGKNQPGIHVLLDCLIICQSAVWEPLLPLGVIHFPCGHTATHSWILPLLTISVTGKQTRGPLQTSRVVKCAVSVGRLPGVRSLFGLPARKLLNPPCPSFLICKMEGGIKIWFWYCEN